MTEEFNDCLNHELIRWLLRDAEVNRGGVASTVLTGMLLLDHPLGALRAEITSAIGKGVHILDEGLMFSLAKRASRPTALRLLCTAAAWDAPGPLFAKLFQAIVPEISRCSDEERMIVAACLVGRTNRWRSEADAYARQIRALLFDPNPEVATEVVPTISKLSRVTSEDIETLSKAERYQEYFIGFADSHAHRTHYAAQYPDGFAAEVLFLVRTAGRAASVDAALARWRDKVRGAQTRCASLRAVTFDDAATELRRLVGLPAIAAQSSPKTRGPERSAKLAITREEALLLDRYLFESVNAIDRARAAFWSSVEPIS